MQNFETGNATQRKQRSGCWPWLRDWRRPIDGTGSLSQPDGIPALARGVTSGPSGKAEHTQMWCGSFRDRQHEEDLISAAKSMWPFLMPSIAALDEIAVNDARALGSFLLLKCGDAPAAEFGCATWAGRHVRTEYQQARMQKQRKWGQVEIVDLATRSRLIERAKRTRYVLFALFWGCWLASGSHCLLER